MSRAPTREEVAEVLCVERCAQMGDPPCSRVEPQEPHCDDCLGQAEAVLEAFSMEGRP